MKLTSTPLIVLLGLASGCAKNMASIEVDGVCALPDNCTFSGTCDAFLLSRPIVDVATLDVPTLRVYVELKNQMTADATDTTTGHVNTHDAYVEEISVSYESLTPGVSLPGTGSHTAATVKAASTSIAEMYIVDRTSGASLGALTVPTWDPVTQNYWDLIAKVTVKGHLQDLSEFKSAPYEIPFRVCSGCVTACPVGTMCGDEWQEPKLCASP